jgi:hypothetical protein
MIQKYSIQKGKVTFHETNDKRQGPGDLIVKATSAIGIKPCGGCKQRQQQLNNWWFELSDKLTEAIK